MSENIDRAFDELYRSTSGKILKFALSKCGNLDDAYDIVQKTYLDVYERLKKDSHAYDAVKDPLRYLLKIAEIKCCKYYKKNTLEKENIPVFSAVTDDENFANMEALLGQEVPEYNHLDTQEIWEHIKKLDPLTVKICVLYFYRDEKLADIAKTLNVSQSTVKNRLYRTIEKLKQNFNFS